MVHIVCRQCQILSYCREDLVVELSIDAFSFVGEELLDTTKHETVRTGQCPVNDVTVGFAMGSYRSGADDMT